MMELLVSRGADVNALWRGRFPTIFSPCETVDPLALKWLLDHGADPNCTCSAQVSTGTALDYLISSYLRSPQLAVCIGILLEAGAVTQYNVPVVLQLLCGRIDLLSESLDAQPELLHRRFPELDFGATGTRDLTLRGATLLHLAAEYGNLEATRLLLERGADVNARAEVDQSGVGGQTPIFHAVTQQRNWGFAVAQLLIDRGADLSIRVNLPGHYERPGEIVTCTPLGYALRFPDGADNKSVELLRQRGARE
jgi:hypothetical protein